jgi:hypothetical protein
MRNVVEKKDFPKENLKAPNYAEIRIPEKRDRMHTG